jgi:hypothetical protein
MEPISGYILDGDEFDVIMNVDFIDEEVLHYIPHIWHSPS